MEKIINLARKLKALAEQGVGGEKETSAVMLERLMKKHGITMDQLNGNIVSDHFFDLNKEDEKLFIQIAGNVTNGSAKIFDVHGNKRAIKYYRLVVECTAAEAVEIQAKFEFFKSAYKKEVDIFYKAFVHKNNLAINRKDKDEETEPTQEEIEEMKRIVKMMKSIERANYFKQLENKKD